MRVRLTPTLYMSYVIIIMERIMKKIKEEKIEPSNYIDVRKEMGNIYVLYYPVNNRIKWKTEMILMYVAKQVGNCIWLIREIRQGCPLSPLLLNILISERYSGNSRG